MDFYLSCSPRRPYSIANPDEIPTPRLLMFRDRFASNIDRMRAHLAAAAPGCGLDRVWPHAKTHKSLWVTRALLEAGISAFKASPGEVPMLLAAGVPKAFVAYPLVPQAARRMAELAAQNPRTRWVVQLANREQLNAIQDALQRHDLRWEYLIDLDVGMHRTGIPPARALDFFRSIPASPHLTFAGFHAYDGHNHLPDPGERDAEAVRSFTPVAELIRTFEAQSTAVATLVVSGTPSFLSALKFLSGQRLNTAIVVSPGTWVYSDTNYETILPGAFDIAACLLVQVIDRPAPDKATLNFGHKRWSVDMGPLECFSVAGMQAVGWSEEHTVVTLPADVPLNFGDYVLAAPRHVCPTVNLYEQMTVIGPGGDVEVLDCPIEARNR